MVTDGRSDLRFPLAHGKFWRVRNGRHRSPALLDSRSGGLNLGVETGECLLARLRVAQRGGAVGPAAEPLPVARRQPGQA